MKRLLFGFVLIGIILLPINGFAENEVPDETIIESSIEEDFIKQQKIKLEFEEEKIVPVILSEEHFALEEESIFDATDTKMIAPSHGSIKYSWDFGDESAPVWGENVSHTYNSPGIYTVKLKASQGRISESITKNITIYDRTGILVIDTAVPSDGIIYQASENGILLHTIPYHGDESGFSAEENFIRLVQSNVNNFKNADILLFYSQDMAPLQSFGQFWQKLETGDLKFNPKEKIWIQVSQEGSLNKSAKILQPVFSILEPNSILLTRPDALNIIFKNNNALQILEVLKSREIEHILVDERTAISKFLILSRLITVFVSNGLSQNTIYLLLATPFLCFIIVFFRQFIGIFTFGVYAPLMLALSFFVLGLTFGLLVFFSVIIVSAFIRYIFEKVELLYIPKIGLLFSVISCSFFVVLGLALYLEISINLTLTIFPMLVMSSLSEKLISSQSTGIKHALIATIKTAFVALIAYEIVALPSLKETILSFPEFIIIPLLLIIWLGRFTGLRLSEYFKFRDLFQEDSQEEE